MLLELWIELAEEDHDCLSFMFFFFFVYVSTWILRQSNVNIRIH